MTVSLRMIGD